MIANRLNATAAALFSALVVATLVVGAAVGPAASISLA